MGGRRSYKVKHVVGTSRSIISEKRKLTSALKKKDPKEIAVSSAKLIAKSELSLKNLAMVTKLADFIGTSVAKKEFLSYKERRKLASEAWTKIKKAEKIETTPEVDKIIVTSATKAIRRRRK